MYAITILAPVLFDGNDQFLGGQLLGVRSDAIVVGTVQKSVNIVPAPTTPGVLPTHLVDTLFVKDTVLGGLYLSWTMAQWDAALGQTQTSPNSGRTYTVTITGTPSTVQSNSLINAVITQVSVNGIIVDERTITFDSSTGTITFSSSLSTTDVVQVNYYLN